MIFPDARVIDITGVARPFALMKAFNVTILTVAIGAPIAIVSDLVWGRYTAELLLPDAIQLCVLGFAGVLAWRNVNPLNAVIQPLTALSFVLVIAGAGYFVGSLALAGLYRDLFAVSPSDLEPGVWAQLVTEWLFPIMIVVLAVCALIGLVVARLARIRALDMRLSTFLRRCRESESRADRGVRAPAKNAPLGGALVALGFAILVATGLIPDSYYYSNLLLPILTLLATTGAFLIVLRARALFAPDARALLGADPRPPVLLLRSFADDERTRYIAADTTFLDYSLESRLAGHFSATGPFITVGAPEEGAPQLGAARAKLSDDEWQAQVLAWMDQATLIVAMAGATHWVEWELANVASRGHAHKLILLFPQSRKWIEFEQEATDRFEHLCYAFERTPWGQALKHIEKPERIKAILFEPDGGLTVVQSRVHNRNAHHLAALIAHFLLQQRAGSAP